MAGTSPTRRSTVKAAIAGLVLFVLADLLGFRWGLYGFVAEPESNAGWAAMRVLHDEWLLDDHVDLAAFGDSRIGEAFAEDVLRARWQERELTARCEHIPGASPRVQSLLLERLDPRGGRYRVVLVGLTSYDDSDVAEDYTNRTLDLAFLPPVLGLSSAWSLATSFDDPDARREAWLVSLFKSYAWRRDVQDLAAHPRQRYEAVRHRLHAYRWSPTYRGRDGSLAGVRIDGERIVGLPASSGEIAQRLHDDVFTPPVPDTGRMRAYRQKWLGRIVAHEAGTGTQVVFARMPTEVLPRRSPPPIDQGVLDELAQKSHVHVLPRDFFAELERPEFFYDAVHLNRRGRERFTELLATELERRFGPRLGR